MIGNIRLTLALLGAICTLLLLLPFHLLALLAARFGWTWLASRIPVLTHRLILKCFGSRLSVSKKLPRNRPLLLVSNHVSWLDIVVLSAVAPVSFVAKSEMRSWPLFGTLARLQRTVFIERGERRSSGQQASDIANRMTAREIMVLFPEGTTTDGNRLEPFKTTLFEAAKLALKDSPVDEAVVQPVAIEYTHLQGILLGRSGRPHIAWPGDIGLGESLIPVLKAGSLDVSVHVGEPITLTETSNRKIVAAQAAQSIRDMLSSRQKSALDSDPMSR